MSFFLGQYQFEGPFDSISNLGENKGVFAILCISEKGISRPIHLEEAKNIKKRIRNLINSINLTKKCNGRIVYGVFYTSDLDTQNNDVIIYEIKKTYNLN